MGPVASSAALVFSQNAETEGVKGVTGAGEENPDTSSSDLTEGESFLALVAALFPQAPPPPPAPVNPFESDGGRIPTATPARDTASAILGPAASLISWNVASGMPTEPDRAAVNDSALTRQSSPGASALQESASTEATAGEIPVVTLVPPPVPTAEAPLATSPAPGGVPTESIATANSAVSASSPPLQLRDGALESARGTLGQNPVQAIPERALAISHSNLTLSESGVAEGLNLPPTLRATSSAASPPALDDDESDVVTNAATVVEGAVEFREVGTAIETKEAPRPAERVTLDTLADRLPQRIAEHMSGLRETGRAELQMNLHPPELGKIQLHLKLEDGNMHIQMTVQSDSAKRILDQQLEPMRVRFGEMGVGIGQFDVRRDGGGVGSGPTKEESDEIIIGAAGRRRSSLAAAYVLASASSSLVDVLA